VHVGLREDLVRLSVGAQEFVGDREAVD
jgi:hypothetical protein